MKRLLLYSLAFSFLSCNEIAKHFDYACPRLSSNAVDCADKQVQAETFSFPDLSTYVLATNELDAEVREHQELCTLIWQTSYSMGQGSPDAKKGGKFYTAIENFPSTFRNMGPGSTPLSKKLFCNNMPLLVTSQYDAKFLPAAATHWAFGKDGKSVYYRLNPKAHWSTGEPCDQDDFIFAIEFLKRKEIARLPEIPDYSHLAIRKIGTNYLCITYDAPLNSSPELLLTATNITPRPKHFYQPRQNAKITINDKDGKNKGNDLNLNNWVIDYNRKAEPTTFAYYLSEWDEHYGLIFKKVENWWLEDEKYFQNMFNFDSVIFRILPGTKKSRIKYFNKGELDALSIESRSEYIDFLENPLFQSGFVDIWRSTFNSRTGLNGILFNTQNPPLDDIRFRQALEHAIDIDGLIENVLQDERTRCNTMGKNETVDDILFNNEQLIPARYDKKKANELLESAGFTVGKDGIRQNAKGERASLTILYTDIGLRDVFGYLYTKALACGIELDFRFVSGGLLNLIQKGEFQAWWASFASAPVPNHYHILHSNPKIQHPFMQLFRFSSSQLDSLLEMYNDPTITIAEKAELNKKIETTVKDNVLFIPTYTSSKTMCICWKYIRFPGWLKHSLPYCQDSLSTFFCPFGWFDNEIKKDIDETLQRKHHK